MKTLFRLFAVAVAVGVAATAWTSGYGAEHTLRQRQSGDVIILDLTGKITESGGTAALHKAISGMLDEGKLNILLNLKRVSSVDASGLAEMVASNTATEAAGGKLKLLNLSNDVFGGELMITKFLTVFQVYDDEAEAISSFR